MWDPARRPRRGFVQTFVPGGAVAVEVPSVAAGDEVGRHGEVRFEKDMLPPVAPSRTAWARSAVSQAYSVLDRIATPLAATPRPEAG